MQILILILPSEQLLDGWHTSQLHHLGILGGWHIKTQQKTLEIRGTGTLKKKSSQKETWIEVFCLFNKSLQGTCFNWIATSTAKQIKIFKTFPQPFQGVKPVIWLKTKPGLSAQVWCNYALLLSHWGVSLELIIFHRSWRLTVFC